MSITASGLGSGMDIRGIVDDLLAAEGEAKTLKFNADEAETLAKITAVGTLKGALSEFQSSLSDLKDITKFQKRNASSSDDSIFKAVSDTSATSGSYSVEVTQLAVNHRVQSQVFGSKTETLGTGSLVFTRGTTEFSINIPSENQTVQGIADAVNETSSETGITATLINSDAGTQIIFSAKDEGVDNIFTVSVTDDADGNNADDSGLSQLDQSFNTIKDAGLDSIVLVDGLTVTSSTNSVEDAIEGITLDLIKTNIGEPETLTVAVDTQAADLAVRQFVSGYNAVFTEIRSLSQFNGEDSDTQGILIGDATLRNLEIRIRREINTFNATSGTAFSSIAQLGIKSNDQTGLLEVQSSELSSALSSNFDSIGELFANTEDGLAKRMDNLIEEYNRQGGILDSKSDILNDRVNDISEERIDLERELQNLETRLLSQFIAMDSIVASFQSTGDFLTAQLDRLAGPLAYKK